MQYCVPETTGPSKQMRKQSEDGSSETRPTLLTQCRDAAWGLHLWPEVELSHFCAHLRRHAM